LVEQVIELLRAFLRDNVTSYEQLSALLVLARSPTRAWSLAELSQEVRLPSDLLESALGWLEERGLIARTAGSGLRYAPRDAAAGQQVEVLLRAYDEQRLTIVKLMNESALERMRKSAARRFGAP
jgi:hypothetical protein